MQELGDRRGRERLVRVSRLFRALLEDEDDGARAFADGTVVFREGDEADGLYLILSGRAAVLSEKGGDLIHLRTLHEGQCFGELGVIKGAPRSATVVARGPLRTAFVDRARVEARLRTEPELRRYLDTLIRGYELPRRGSSSSTRAAPATGEHRHHL
jgi:CRP-like cAMP-binding protein